MDKPENLTEQEYSLWQVVNEIDCAENYDFRRLLTTISTLRKERDEALMLTESCSTLKDMANACVAGAAATASLASANARMERMEKALEAAYEAWHVGDDQHLGKILKAALTPAPKEPNDA